MSRTRRNPINSWPVWSMADFNDEAHPGFNEWWRKRAIRDHGSLERAIAKENATRVADMRSGNRNAPAWFRRMFCVRPIKRRDNATLRKVLIGQIDPDSATFTPFYRNAKWKWW